MANAEFFFGDPGDRLVSGDWGIVDGIDTPAMFRPSNTTFFFRHSNTQGVADRDSDLGLLELPPGGGTMESVRQSGDTADAADTANTPAATDDLRPVAQRPYQLRLFGDPDHERRSGPTDSCRRSAAPRHGST